MKKQKFSTRVLAEVSIFAALAFALDALQAGIWRGVFFSGGSIGLAMLPIFVVAYRRGFLAGFLCGFIVSLVQMLGGIYVINASSFENEFLKVMGPFLQILLDYVLAYTVVGFAGAFSKSYQKATNRKQRLLWILIGTILCGLLKYACHVVAGGVFWLNQGATFAGIADTSWLYSFLYNAAYCIPNIIICTGIMALLASFYPQFLTVSEGTTNNQNKEDAIDAEYKEVQ